MTQLINSCISGNDYESYTIYGGNLGLFKENDTYLFKIWAPTAEKVILNLYNEGRGGEVSSKETMSNKKGVWQLELENVKGKYYTYQTLIGGTFSDEVVDPYAKLVGINGERGYIGDLSETNPSDWDDDKRPVLSNYQNMILYELHIRDLSMDQSSGISNKGKFLGFTEKNTKTKSGMKTGLDHLVELGITHIHIMPAFDFRSIDETNIKNDVFNWGYDPLNYNVPEGSFCTDPGDPYNRVAEFKRMIKALHDNGLGVIMDVVYNHTGPTEKSSFNQLVPGYYYRHNENSDFSDASACGNETASERFMVRKFMIESMRYWVEEYHIDGFRVDLMGIHDIETMNQITKELHKIDSSIFIYGEGWTAGTSPLADSLRALKGNTYKLDKVAVFSDDLRDGIKGHWSDKGDRGFVSAKSGTKESIKFGIVASTMHSQIDYSKVNYSNAPWAREPWQTISYVSCHDDLTLWDKLIASNPDASEEELIKMHKLSNTIVMTSQGIPFLHGGVDLLRTKNGVSNSFSSSDEINSIKWENKEKYYKVFQYYQKLIELRKAHSAFRMQSTEQIQKHLSFFETKDDLIIGYQVINNANGDEWKNILVFFNGNNSSRVINLPEGEWVSVIQEGEIDMSGIAIFNEGKTQIASRSALVLYQN